MEDLIVGICGRAGTGKNTFCELSTGMLTTAGVDSVHTSFASPIKRLIVDCYGIPEEYAFGGDTKKKTSFGTWGDFFPLTMPKNKLPSDKMSVREMLTHLGTDIFRNTVDKEFWTKTFKRRVEAKRYDTEFVQFGGRRIVYVTDVRFQNEVDIITEMGGYNIKLDRLVPFHSHSSEDSVDLIPDECFWRLLEDEQIRGIRNLKIQISSIIYALELAA